MAISFVLGNGTAWGSSHGYVQDGGLLPSVVRTATGWTAGTKAAGQSSILLWGTKRASTTLSATLQPDGATTPGTTDCLRSVNSYRGSFASGTWTLAFALRSQTAAYTGRCRLRIRVWRSANQDGSSATEITSGAIVTAATTANLSTTVNVNISGTWSAPAITLADEYLFFQVGVEVTSAGGGSTQDILLTTDSTNSKFTTTTFTAATNAYTRNVVTNLPASVATSKDYVLADDQSTIGAIQQDVNPSGSKDLFAVILASTSTATDVYNLIVSTDGGATWSAIAASNAEPNADGNHFPNLQAIVQDDSTYAVHFVGKNATDSNLWYSRITLSYTSGHITGWNWAAERSATPSLNATLVQPYRVTMQRITDGNSVKRLMVTCLDDPASGTPGVGVVCRLIVFATTPSAGLAPTANTSWCKLTSSSATNAFDILGDWSSNTTSDASSLKHFTNQDATRQNSYTNCCTAAQIGTNHDIHAFMGGFYYNDAQASPGSIWRWRLTVSGSNWSNDGTVNGATIAVDNGTVRPCIGNAVGRTNAAYLAYYDATGVPKVFKVDSGGTTSAPFGSMETAVTGSMGYVGIGVSTDETQCWASYMLGFNTGPTWRVAHYDGSVWKIRYDETLDWNNSATGESVPWWTGQDVFDGVVIGSYQLGDYATTHHHNAVHVFRSAASTAAALTGAVSSSASVTGALSTGIQLTGSVSSPAAVTGSLTTGIRLTGAVANAAAVTGALSTGIQLAGAVASTAAATGALSTGIQLAGAVSSTAAPTGALTTKIQLTGAVSSSAAVAGDLAGSATALTGAVASSASVAGNLTTGIPLSGAVVAAGVPAGVLTTAIQLAGAVASPSAVSGTLTTGIRLTGAVTSSAAVTGALGGAPAQLTGAVASSASVSGALSTGIQLAGAATSSSAPAGALSTGIQLSGAVAGAGAVAGVLTTGILLTGSVSSFAAVAANLLTGIRLSGALVSSASVLGALGNNFKAPAPAVIGAFVRTRVRNGTP